MHAIQLDGDNLVWAETADLEPGPGEVLISNKATAVNRADLAQRAGRYPAPPGASPILGLECAGEVLAIGEGVARVAVGDRVCALLAGGGYAEQVVVPAGQVLPIPSNLDWVQAAAVPEVFATAYLNIFMEAAASTGERVLLHAGASGVGTAGIQLCRAFGNPVWVTAGDDAKIEQCVALGAEGGANRHSQSFAELANGWTGGAGFDVILDPVGAAYLADNIKCLALDGRLVVIGLMGGVAAEVNLGAMMMKRLRLIGSTLRARPVAAKAAVMDALQERVWPLLESGEIQPVVETVMPIRDADAAHTLVAGNSTVGKVVLALD